MTNDNYITIQGFMITELKLKGNELLIYAIIYGFSQLENQEFKGSLQYLADWCNSTKQGVLKALKSLIEKGLIERKEMFLNGVKFVYYYSTKFNGIKQSLTGCSTKFNGGIKQSLTGCSTKFNGGIKQSLPNNINNNINNNIKENIKEKINVIIDYLNQKTGKHYRNGGKTEELIKARLNEKYTVDDFKHVIDVKCSQWLKTSMEIYLRPETLFNRTKFESYLNEQEIRTLKENPIYDQNGGFEEL